MSGPTAPLLPRGSEEEIDRLFAPRFDPAEREALDTAARIVDDVRARGETALREHAERLGDLEKGAPLVADRAALEAALAALPAGERGALERMHVNVRAFARRQKATLREFSAAVPGGDAGHEIAAVERAGCYAPGGRHPLPSSVLMTATVAREAGVATVWVASPRPARATLAAAAIAGADALLAAGGAQAIAALAYGAGAVPKCDAVVGPGNRYVTAAKRLVAGTVLIDSLAGPSELVVLADASVDPARIAADLVAQAEHDPDARVALVTCDAALADAVAAEASRQIETLPTAAVARAALEHGRTFVLSSLDAAIAACDRLAPEHLAVWLADPDAAAPRLRHYGALFLGAETSVAFGDYGAGPNHVLPTGGTARSSGGLSVLTFLRVRTWLRVHPSPVTAALARDAALLARLEGLEGHARAAERRTGG